MPFPLWTRAAVAVRDSLKPDPFTDGPHISPTFEGCEAKLERERAAELAALREKEQERRAAMRKGQTSLPLDQRKSQP